MQYDTVIKTLSFVFVQTVYLADNFVCYHPNGPSKMPLFEQNKEKQTYFQLLAWRHVGRDLKGEID